MKPYLCGGEKHAYAKTTLLFDPNSHKTTHLSSRQRSRDAQPPRNIKRGAKAERSPSPLCLPSFSFASHPPFCSSGSSLKIKSGSEDTSLDPTHVPPLPTQVGSECRQRTKKGCTELPDSGLAPLRYYGSNIRSLYLDCCFGITDHGVSAIAAGCRSLTVISLYRCNITDVGLETLASGCADLQKVNLTYCSLISDCGLRALSQGCHNLRAIKIAHCRDVTGVGIRGCSPTLIYVDAESCKLDAEGITGIVSGGGLEYLNIGSVGWWLGPDSFIAIGSGFAQRLKILNLRLCRSIGDESAAAIARGCPLLQEWNLALCHGIKTPGWQAIGLHCNNLEKLHVNRCRNLCDPGLEALRRGCKKLTVLYIGRGSRVSGVTIELFKMLRNGVEIKDEEVMCLAPERAASW
ncbi:hypothetical protein NL676_022078 [Syzygium grande]|nr:hypothetical protein NL676_022078 [Syzygium grande]